MRLRVMPVHQTVTHSSQSRFHVRITCRYPANSISSFNSHSGRLLIGDEGEAARAILLVLSGVPSKARSIFALDIELCFRGYLMVLAP
jgi:hypothetical protein